MEQLELNLGEPSFVIAIGHAHEAVMAANEPSFPCANGPNGSTVTALFSPGMAQFYMRMAADAAVRGPEPGKSGRRS